MKALVGFNFSHPLTYGYMDEIANSFIYQIGHNISGKETPSEKCKHDVIPEFLVLPNVDGDTKLYFRLVCTTMVDSITKERIPCWVFTNDVSFTVSTLVGIRNVAINVMKKVDAITRLYIATYTATNTHLFETILRGGAPAPAQG